MNRRGLLQGAAVIIPFLSGVWSWVLGPARGQGAVRAQSRVRPGDPAWPSEADWNRLSRDVGGRLVKVRSLLVACTAAPASPACAQVFKDLKNPYYLGDEIGLTQSLGWVDAWTSRPSVYGVAARTTDDVVAAVNFAREHSLRLVVKGGGHSYQGTSNAADSLLIWTHEMDAVTVHDAFVGVGCAGRHPPQPAVTVEAGAIWGQVYDAVTTKAARYVQGGGCLTVGVAGLIQSGGFGSFSKAYGMAAASLLEAEVVTADGAVRIANACTNPDLFWGLKGGGGGSLGVVTRLTLRTHDLPAFFGAAFMTIKATSDAAFRRLIGRVVSFYQREPLQSALGRADRLPAGQPPRDRHGVPRAGPAAGGDNLAPVPRLAGRFAAGFQHRVGAMDRVSASPALLGSRIPQRDSPASCLRTIVRALPRPTCSGRAIWARRDRCCTATSRRGSLPRYCSRTGRNSLGDALFAASRHWRVSLHLNKGLAGAPADAIAAARDTAMNPAVLDAFALVISAAEGPPAYPGIPGHEPDLVGRSHARRGDRPGHVRDPRPAPDRRLLCGGEQFLRAGVAGLLLGSELPEAARREGQVRSRRPVHRPSRRWQ